MKIGYSGLDEVDEGRFCLVLIGEGSTGEKVIESVRVFNIPLTKDKIKRVKKDTMTDRK